MMYFLCLNYITKRILHGQSVVSIPFQCIILRDSTHRYAVSLPIHTYIPSLRGKKLCLEHQVHVHRFAWFAAGCDRTLHDSFQFVIIPHWLVIAAIRASGFSLDYGCTFHPLKGNNTYLPPSFCHLVFVFVLVIFISSCSPFRLH